MGKGDRANLERLLRSAWERQTLLKATHKKNPKHDTALFLTIAFGLAGPLTFMLQANGLVTINWWMSLFVYTLILSFFLWAFLRWESPSHWGQTRKLFTCVLMCVLMASLSGAAVRIQYKKEHIPPLTAEIYSGDILTITDSRHKCAGYTLYIWPEATSDEDVFTVSLATLHITIQFPDTVRDYRVDTMGSGGGMGSAVIYKEGEGCRFYQAQHVLAANVTERFNPVSNEFSLTANTFDAALFVEFLTDSNGALPSYDGVVVRNSQVKARGQYQFKADDPLSEIKFNFVTKLDTRKGVSPPHLAP